LISTVRPVKDKVTNVCCETKSVYTKWITVREMITKKLYYYRYSQAGCMLLAVFSNTEQNVVTKINHALVMESKTIKIVC